MDTLLHYCIGESGTELNEKNLIRIQPEPFCTRLLVLTFFGSSGSMLFVSYGGCSSGVEHQIVDLAVVGSKPITHPCGQDTGFRLSCS